MCQKCIDLCRELKMPEDEISNFLWSATSFPFDEWPRMGEKIKTAWKKSGHSVGQAIANADKEMSDAEDDIERRKK